MMMPVVTDDDAVAFIRNVVLQFVNDSANADRIHSAPRCGSYEDGRRRSSLVESLSVRGAVGEGDDGAGGVFGGVGRFLGCAFGRVYTFAIRLIL